MHKLIAAVVLCALASLVDAAEPIGTLIDRATTAEKTADRSKAVRAISEQLKDGEKLNADDADKCREIAVELVGDRGSRSHCAAILVFAGDTTSVPTLIDLLGDDDISVRMIAGEALGYIGGKEAADALAEAAIEHQEDGTGFLNALVDIANPLGKESLKRVLKESKSEDFTKSVQFRIDKLSGKKITKTQEKLLKVRRLKPVQASGRK